MQLPWKPLQHLAEHLWLTQLYLKDTWIDTDDFTQSLGPTVPSRYSVRGQLLTCIYPLIREKLWEQRRLPKFRASLSSMISVSQLVKIDFFFHNYFCFWCNIEICPLIRSLQPAQKLVWATGNLFKCVEGRVCRYKLHRRQKGLWTGSQTQICPVSQIWGWLLGSPSAG